MRAERTEHAALGDWRRHRRLSFRFPSCDFSAFKHESPYLARCFTRLSPIMKIPSIVLWSTIVAALGGLLFGFDTAVISGTTTALEQMFDLNQFWLGFTVASALVGTVVGSILAGKPSDLFGRRATLLVIAALYAISSLGCGLAWDWRSLLVLRFLGGIAVGGASVVSPMYIAEISPSAVRGRLVAMQQFNVCLGICLAYVSNYMVSVIPWIPETAQWRWMFGVQVIPSTVFFLALFLIPESPRWLVERRRIDDARNSLHRLKAKDVEGELGEIVNSFSPRQEQGAEPLFCRKYRFPIMAAVALAMFNQLTGINALLYYAPKVFAMGNSGARAALLQSIPVGIMLVVSTTVGMMVIDRFGRKTLLLVGSIGMAVFLALVGQCFWAAAEGADIGRTIMWYFIGYILFFGFSQGAVIWVFISEIFPNMVRAKGQALGSFTHWFGAMVVSLLFPWAAANPWIGPGKAFMFFSAMMIVHFVFVWKVLPETKQISLERIQQDLGIE
jgi:sugar porter (SP) family MFS transporter